MSKAQIFEPEITVGTAYSAVVPETILRHSVVLEPKVGMTSTQTITPETVS